MSQQKKKSQVSTTTADNKTSLQVKQDRKQDRTSPLIRVRFRNPIRTSVCGGDNQGTAAGAKQSSAAAGEKGSRGGGGNTRRRRLSLDDTSMSTEEPDTKNSSVETAKDDLVLEPRIHQYEKHKLLQERSPESGLSEVEAFLLEKQRLIESAPASETTADAEGEEGEDKLVPRAPQYEPHPILQVKTEDGMTELELYFKEKDAEQTDHKETAGTATMS